MTPRFRVELLEPHDRTPFTSGIVALDRYLREQATQDVRRRATACYVAVDTTMSRVAGFYTLAAGGIPLGEIGADVACFWR
jgi:hypothetical protein